MPTKATTPAEYLASLEPERRAAVTKLHRVIKKHLPKGFVDTISYGMIGYVVPHKLYPAGYHCDPKQPLPFMSLASQKQGVSVHHLGLYEGSIVPWFTKEWKKATDAKLDLGKGCVRMKKVDDIPYELFGNLAARMTPADWIALYEKKLKR